MLANAMPAASSEIDVLIRVVLALTAAWFVVAAIWLMRLQAQVGRHTGRTAAAPTTRVQLAWLAVPLLAIPGGWLLQPEQAESLPTNLVESMPLKSLPHGFEPGLPVDPAAKDHHPSPIVAVSHPVHPI
jgi:hypothetical protein